MPIFTSFSLTFTFTFSFSFSSNFSSSNIYPSNFLLRFFQCEESFSNITSSKNKKKSRIEKRGERVGKSSVSRLQIKYDKCQVKCSEVGCVWGLVWCGVCGGAWLSSCHDRGQSRGQGGVWCMCGVE
jgi:hypothetical protein